MIYSVFLFLGNHLTIYPIIRNWLVSPYQLYFPYILSLLDCAFITMGIGSLIISWHLSKYGKLFIKILANVHIKSKTGKLILGISTNLKSSLLCQGN